MSPIIYVAGLLTSRALRPQVAVRWLEAPSPWRWPPEVGGGGDGGVEARFGPHHPPGAGLHWVRPAAMAAAAVMRQGTLEVRGFG